jgi:hypothetical protein
MSPDDELLLEWTAERAGTPEPGRVCENCGYADPNACAMTCPMCDTRHPGVGIRTD